VAAAIGYMRGVVNRKSGKCWLLGLSPLFRAEHRLCSWEKVRGLPEPAERRAASARLWANGQALEHRMAA